MRYEIRMEGVLDQCWSCWFNGLAMTTEPGGVTVITGYVADQAALHRLIAKLRDLCIPLICLRRLVAD